MLEYARRVSDPDCHDEFLSGDKIDRAAAAKSTGLWLLITIPLFLGSLYVVIYAVITGEFVFRGTVSRKDTVACQFIIGLL